MQTIDFQTEPARYRHWSLEFHGEVAYLIMDVDHAGGLFDGYELKLNSYDLGVDIELNDAVQRLRFEHPEVRCVVIKSGKDNVFCAGANIRMLGKSTHGQKVNFCKFTNETRLAIEDASENSKLDALHRAKKKIGVPVEGEEAAELGLVTQAYEDFDWNDELRLLLEERTSFSPDAMTGMEANLRFAGPETMETKIFGRLSAWQNWIFQRPNAIGEQGALKLYGSGVSPTFNKERV